MTRSDTTAAFNALIATAQSHVNAARWSDAIAALEGALAVQPEAQGALRALGNAKREAGDVAGGSAAHGQAARLSLARSPLKEAVAAVNQNKLATAEQVIRDRLKAAPDDIAAIQLLADLAARAGNVADAKRFLAHALQIAPDHDPARSQLALLFYNNRDLPEALAEFNRLLVRDPKHPGHRNKRAATLDLLGDHDGALAAYHAMLADDPDQPLVWMTIGNIFKTIGDIPAAIDAFRRSLSLAPATGESWWGLANLKSFRFDENDIAAMRAELARPSLSGANRAALEFALGAALEGQGDYAESFAHYVEGNRLQRQWMAHDPDYLAKLHHRYEAVFTPDFFTAREGWGDPAPDPIFIVGLPRSGSTLVEQILASHPEIESTMELPEMPRLIRMLGGLGPDPERAPYPDVFTRLPGRQVAGIGVEYLRRAAHWRQTERRFFIDKLPLNFVSVGMIRLALPNAKIIDVRRHPLGCGFSLFKQYFPSAQSFTSDLGDIGHFYAEYVRMMQLWDDVLPGHVHRLFYEDLVSGTEAEVRRLLDFVGLPFDPVCLDFHTRARVVRTPSAEQVRRPIYPEGMEHWRHFDTWLEPMKEALGDVLARYPDCA